MGKNTHQHFVPKFYQKGFSENNLIYSLDKNTKPYKPEKISIRDSLVKKNIYSLENVESNIEQILEEALSEIEGDMSVIIKKISSCEELSLEDMTKFIYFIAVQRVRSPVYLEEVKEQLLEVNKIVASLGIDEIETTKNYILENSFSNIDKIYQVLLQRKWLFLINTNKDSVFITSDFPVYCLPPRDHHLNNINNGWSLEETIHFPITQNIIAICKKVEGKTKKSICSYIYKKNDIEQNFVDTCNKLTAIASDGYIISSKSEVLINSLNFSDLDLKYSNLSKKDTVKMGNGIVIISRF